VPPLAELRLALRLQGRTARQRLRAAVTVVQAVPSPVAAEASMATRPSPGRVQPEAPAVPAARPLSRAAVAA
jgi:hypothetical protein